jgi:hypothetical protein
MHLVCTAHRSPVNFSLTIQYNEEIGMTRFSTIACVTVAGALVATPVASAADLSGYFGNTVVCSSADGTMTKVWITDGGKYTINRGTGDIKGTWVASGDTACFTETDPAPPAGTKAFCPPAGAHKVGDTWSLTQPDGKASQCMLKEGTS